MIIVRAGTAGRKKGEEAQMKRHQTFLCGTAIAMIVFGGAEGAFAQRVDPSITVALAVEPDSLDSCDTQPAQSANIMRGNPISRCRE